MAANRPDRFGKTAKAGNSRKAGDSGGRAGPANPVVPADGVGAGNKVVKAGKAGKAEKSAPVEQAVKAVKATKKAVKGAQHEVAKSARKMANQAAAGMPSPEKERSQAHVSDGTIGAPARDTAVAPEWAQAGNTLTTDYGVPVDDTDNSLTVGPRGPGLLADFHLREKIMHFDHERIPERVVHARGTGVHGRFQVTQSLADLTCAQVLTDTAIETPVFVRFSTVAGSRGSFDTARDVRGFAVKFYTDQGIWDLVGNNIPVFFIQDGIKFPDIIHAVKPEPDREIPQAQSAHDTFWDFVSLTPETTHMLMWVMSDRAIPRSFRTMQGFGVHSFRLYDAAGKTSLVKFHWRPAAGTHSLVWEESQMLGGVDPDFHRRDLWDAVEAGAPAVFELSVQVFPDTEDQMFEGIDLLDSTKIVPEELAPLRPVGRLTLDRNPTNFFAETEQVAFCTSHVVPGIDFSDDPLLAARNFSYFDTQLTRLGGPNFNQLPINRARSAVNTMQRDGYGQQAIHEGVAPYAPNSFDGGGPVAVGSAGYVHVPRPVSGRIVRERPASFGDHFRQATLFWNSMSAPERDHIVGAFAFELGKCVRMDVRERTLANLANVDAELCERVAAHLGLPAPMGSPAADVGASAALSQIPTAPGPVAGRTVGLLAADGVDRAGVEALRRALGAAGATLYVVAPHGGTLNGDGGPVPVDRTVLTTQSVEYDALVVAGGASAALVGLEPYTAVNLGEAFRHHKTIGAWGEGQAVLERCSISSAAPGVVVAEQGGAGFATQLIEAMGWHRHWTRVPLTV